MQEYQVTGEKRTGPADTRLKGKNGDSHFIFLFAFASTEIRCEREVWAYTTISFISDMGGALSLFIGVSFLSVWDFLDYFLVRFRN